MGLHNQAGKCITELSNEYGIPKSTISTLVKALSPIAVSETETISLKEYKALQKKMKKLEIENKILKSYCYTRQKSIAEYLSFIQFNLKQMYKILGFPKSTYYATINHKTILKEQEYNEFSAQVLSVYHEFKKCYGTIKLQKELSDRSFSCSVKRVQRQMHRLGIKSIVVRKYQYTKNLGTVPDDKENILNRDFDTDTVLKNLLQILLIST